MDAESFSKVVEMAIEATGKERIPSGILLEQVV